MAFWPALLLARERAPAVGAARPAGRRRRAAGGGRAAQPEPRLAVRDAGDARARVRAAARPHAHLRALLVPVAAGSPRPRRRCCASGITCGAASVVPATLHSATVATFVAALAVAALVAPAARPSSPGAASPAQSARRLRVVTAGVAVARARGRPRRRAGRCRQPASPVPNTPGTASRAATANGSGNRLLSGLGSNRYDFYRVALDEFVAHPLVGIGADNFQQQYLARGPQRRDALATRTASSCARSPRRACSVRCWRSSAWAPRCSPPGARFAARTRWPRSVAAAALARLRLLGRARFRRLVLGVRRPGRARVRDAGSRLCAGAAPPAGSRTGRGRAGREHGGRAPTWRQCRLSAEPAGRVRLRSGHAGCSRSSPPSLAAPWLSRLEVQSAARIWPDRPARPTRA